MKLSCLQENLNKGIGVVSRLVAQRGTLEILSHILLATEKGRLKLSATNLEIGINYKIGAKIDSEGSITVPARLFHDFVSQLPTGKIDLELKESTLVSKIGDFESQINGLSAEEFPLIPRIKEDKVFSIKASEFKEAINQVSFSAALDEARPVLAGIFLKVSKGQLILAATDSYRLAEKRVNLAEKNTKEIEVIVPARSMIEFSRILDDGAKEVNVYLDETQAMFETEEVEFTSRLVEGKFPDYEQIIPKEAETKAVFEKGEFFNVIKVVALFSRESAGSVTLNVKSGKIEAVSAGSQFGESRAAANAKIEGKDAEIVFNSKYILDVLNNVSDGSISLEMSGKLNPGVMKKEGDKTYVYVIMPLRA